jgi:cytochrome c556
MNRLFVLAGLLALAVIVAGTGVQAEDKDKTPSIKELMQKMHGKKGFRAAVPKEIKDKDWDTAAKDAKAWFTCAQALTKATPKKGEKEDFTKLATTYCKTVKTLLDACESKDAKKANGALGKIGGTCKSCHDGHRGK